MNGRVRASAPIMKTILPEPGLMWFAHDAVLSLLSGGHVNRARIWLRLAQNETAGNAQAREAATRLWAISRFAEPQTDPRELDGAAFSTWLRSIQVPSGFDQADHRIVELLEPGDLVVTADVPLAADVLEKGGYALDPRGLLYTTENIPERLATRNLMDQLRSNGVETGGPAALGKSDRQAFANRLDQLLTRYHSTP